jgi:hypothetical protein
MPKRKAIIRQENTLITLNDWLICRGTQHDVNTIGVQNTLPHPAHHLEQWQVSSAVPE